MGVPWHSASPRGCSGMFRAAPPGAERGRGRGDLVAFPAQTSLPGPRAGSHTVGTARPHPQAWACRCRFWFRRQRVQSGGPGPLGVPVCERVLAVPPTPHPRPWRPSSCRGGLGPHRRRRSLQTERGAPVARVGAAPARAHPGGGGAPSAFVPGLSSPAAAASMSGWLAVLLCAGRARRGLAKGTPPRGLPAPAARPPRQSEQLLLGVSARACVSVHKCECVCVCVGTGPELRVTAVRLSLLQREKSGSYVGWGLTDFDVVYIYLTALWSFNER